MLVTDPFDLLGLPPDAPREAVRRAYRKLAMRWHPDRNPHSRDAEDRFKAIKAAHDLALDPAAYAAWREDRATKSAAAAAAATTAPPTEATRAADPALETTLTLSLEAAAHGGLQTVRVDQSRPCAPCGGGGQVAQAHSVPCPQCRGVGRLRSRSAAACPGCAGRGYVRLVPCTACAGLGRVTAERIFDVRVPPGRRAGDTLRLSSAEGSVLLRLALAPHPFLSLQDDDLHCRVPVDALTAMAGGELTVPTLDGPCAMPLPPGGDGNTPLRFPGCGYPRRRGHGAGDLVVHLNVVMPQDLTASELARLRQFAAALARHGDRCLPAVTAWQARLAAHAAERTTGQTAR